MCALGRGVVRDIAAAAAACSGVLQLQGSLRRYVTDAGIFDMLSLVRCPSEHLHDPQSALAMQS